MWVAGYGPKALAVAGRVGDGVIIQLADPEIIQWIMGTARAAAEEAGRDPAALKCIVCAPSHVGPIEDGREQTRWFPAMVSNHVKDLIERYGTDGSVVPKALTDYVEARKFYDYDEHSRVGAKHGEFVTDEICDRFSVLGDVGQITTKLRELESIGVDHYSIYLMTHGQEETLEAYGKDVIPQFTGAAAVDPRERVEALARGRGRLGAAARADLVLDARRSRSGSSSCSTRCRARRSSSSRRGPATRASSRAAPPARRAPAVDRRRARDGRGRAAPCGRARARGASRSPSRTRRR